MLTSSSSFRDPAGYVFRDNGVYKRTVTVHGMQDYSRFMVSGLYDSLISDRLLLPHTE